MSCFFDHDLHHRLSCDQTNLPCGWLAPFNNHERYKRFHNSPTRQTESFSIYHFMCARGFQQQGSLWKMVASSRTSNFMCIWCTWRQMLEMISSCSVLYQQLWQQWMRPYLEQGCCQTNSKFQVDWTSMFSNIPFKFRSGGLFSGWLQLLARSHQHLLMQFYIMRAGRYVDMAAFWLAWCL